MGALTVGELQVILSGDTRKLNRDLDRIDNRASATERQHSAAWSRIGLTAGAAIKAGMVVATGAVAGLGVAIHKGLDMASFQEQAKISFGTLLGSAVTAKEYLGDLQQFAARTPFELPGVVDAARQLIGVGASAESVIPSLTAWGNASGALGQTQEQFGRTMTAVTQMMGKGKVSAEEMMQVTEAGIPIWALMAKATGKPIGELQKLASEGKLLASDVLPALESQMQKDYGGAMEAQAKTLSGVWSTAKDNLNLALSDGVQPLAAGLKVILPDASEAAGTAIRTMGLRASEGLLNLIKRGQELREQFGPEIGQLGEIAAEKWGAFVDLLDELGDEVAPSLPDVVDSLVRIATVGAEVGEAMLPVLHTGLKLAGPAADALAGTLGIVADTLETIEPVLPLVVAGFIAFKGVSAATTALGAFGGTIASLRTSLSDTAINAGVFTEKLTGSANAGEKVMTGMGRVGTAVARIGSVLPVAGLAFAALGYAIESHRREVEADTQAILDNLTAQGKGGAAGATAGKKLDELRTKIAGLRQEMEAAPVAAATAGAGYGTSGAAARAAAREHDELAGKLHNAEAEYKAIIAAMTPLERAQQDVTYWTNELMAAQEGGNGTSLRAAEAAENLRRAKERQARIEEEVARATQTTTERMAEQITQALAAANADLAMSNATLAVQDAQDRYNAVLADGNATTRDRQRAENDLTGAYNQAAQAAAQKAEADNATKGPAEIATLSAQAQLKALEDLAAQMGGNVPASVQQLIDSLRASAGQANTTAAQMEDLGLSVVKIPNDKTVIVNAPTEDQRRRLSDLGLTVTNIPGSKNVIVTADTSPATVALNALVARNWTINVRANLPDLNGAVSGSGRMGTFASGGQMPARKLALVGEQGPELLFPDRAAYVATAQQTAAMLAAGSQQAARYSPSASGSAWPSGGNAAGSSAFGRSQGRPIEYHKHYEIKATVNKTLTLRELMALQREADALYG